MNKKIECPVIFEPKTHTYRLKSTGEKLISGTTFINLFHEKFDPTGEITKNFAIKKGMSVEEVKEMWKKENKKSTDYGTAVHNCLEDYINTGEITNKEYSWVIDEFKQFKFIGKLIPEKIVYNEELLICGTSDLFDVYNYDGMFTRTSIYDFKTNKKLEKKSYFGNKMLHCCSHLDDVNFNHYTLQLSLYAYLAELKGVIIDKLTILYINPITKKMEAHPVVYQKQLIIEMIDYYQKYLKK